jgi:ABC-type antimicrobial peptide transport system ATPase subunit
MSNRNITVKRRQSLFDIAVQYCGSAEATAEIARMNNIALHEDVQAGTVLSVPPELSKETALKYRLNSIEPATGDVGEQVPSGIDFMGIEIDFIVQ